MGSPKGRESYGDGVPIVVVGVTTHLGGCDTKQLQGEGAAVEGGPELAWLSRAGRTGIVIGKTGEVCARQNADTVLAIIRKQAD